MPLISVLDFFWDIYQVSYIVPLVVQISTRKTLFIFFYPSRNSVFLTVRAVKFAFKISF